MSSLPAPDTGARPADPDRAASRPLGWLSFGGFALVTAGSGVLFATLGQAMGVAAHTAGVTTIVATPAQGLWLIVPVLAGLGWYGLVARREAVPSPGSDLAARFGLTWRIRELDWSAAVAIGLPLGLVAVGLLAGWGSGVQKLRQAVPGHTTVAVALLTVAVAVLVRAVIEEFVCRGYGMAATAGLGSAGSRSAHLLQDLLVGAAWGLWSLPLVGVWMSRPAYRSLTSLPKVVFVPIFLVSLLAMSVVLGELRRRSGSIWPGVVLRTIGGTAAGVLLATRHLTFAGHFDVLYSPAGSVLSIAGFALAGYLIGAGRKPLAT